jgi:hypothetical protein
MVVSGVSTKLRNKYPFGMTERRQILERLQKMFINKSNNVSTHKQRRALIIELENIFETKIINNNNNFPKI